MIGVGNTALLDTSAQRRGAADGRRKRRAAVPDPPPATALLRPPLHPDEQLRAILESLPFAVMSIDMQGRIAFANPALAALFGYTGERLAGVPVDRLIPALAQGTAPWTPVNIRAKLAAAGSQGASGTPARRSDGAEFLIGLTAQALPSATESGTLLAIVDRTDQQELRDNRLALAHLARVSTLGQIAGSLAHELNQPLTAILANAQAAQRLLETPTMYPGEMREILDDLVKDNHRASEVLRKIRLLVRQGEPEIEPLGIAGLVNDVALLVHSDAIARGMRIIVDIPPALPLVSGDRIQLQQVVLNLVLNAFEAMTGRPAADRVLTIHARVDDESRIRVAIRDRGCGFPARTLATLFTPYVTSKREGLGLGLCISRSIVEMHGGKLWAEQNQDLGATIYFTVPMVSATSSPA